MKKIFAFFAVAVLFAGCQNDILDDVPVAKTLSAPLMLSVGENTTRVFDENLVWSWENTDQIIGYQDAGEKTRNTLTLQSENKFACNNFTYSTEDAANFHFFYANEATEGELTAVQDGTWRPVLVGTAQNTTLGEISSVNMEHLSAALEVRVWEGTRENHTSVNVTAATLSSANDFVGKWTVNNNLEYAQTLSGTEISLSDLDTSTVVFNMPVKEEGFAADALKLTLTHKGYTCEYSLPTLTFFAGKRTVINIIIKTAAFLPTGQTINGAIPRDATVVRFVVNSNTENGDNLADGSTYPIYKVVNGTEVEFHTPADKFMANADCSNMFNFKTKLTSIVGLENIDTSNVTDMEYMFYGCKALTELDLSNFNTAKVTNMASMFCGCQALTELDVSKFDTSQVTDMGWMFCGCQALTELDLRNFDTSKVTYMHYMFDRCKALTELDVSKFDTSNVTHMEWMFYGCKALTELDLSRFDTSQVTVMERMFNGCQALTELDLRNFDTSQVTDMVCMFCGCQALTELDLSNFDTSEVTNMCGMFYSCTSITSLDLSRFNTGKVVDMSLMFYGLNKLQTLNLSSFTINNSVVVSNMFHGVRNGNGITYIKVQYNVYRILNGKTNILGTECNYKFTKPEGGSW